MTNRDILWIVIGFAGQVLFALRFMVQWIQSERKGKSVVPIGFWYLSIGGGLTLLAYAIHRRDPVFIAGQASGVAIYVRNLQLIGRERRTGQRADVDVEEDVHAGE